MLIFLYHTARVENNLSLVLFSQLLYEFEISALHFICQPPVKLRRHLRSEVVFPVARLSLADEAAVVSVHKAGVIKVFHVNIRVLLEVVDVKVTSQLVNLLVRVGLPKESCHLADLRPQVLLHVLEEEEAHVWMMTQVPCLNHVLDKWSFDNGGIHEVLHVGLKRTSATGYMLECRIYKGNTTGKLLAPI